MAVLAGIAGESFAQDSPFLVSAKHTKRIRARLRVSVLYPSNRILTSGKPQVVQVVETVQPSTGTPLNEYQLVLTLLKHNGLKVLSDSFSPSDTSSVTTLSMDTVAPGEYDLAAELQQNGTTVSGPRLIRIKNAVMRLQARPRLSPQPRPRLRLRLQIRLQHQLLLVRRL